MPQFRKKPVEIEARQFASVERDIRAVECGALLEWCGGRAFEDASDGWCILIDTLEGQMKARVGDWIIKGVQGEFYPCKPGIFAATYEPA